MTDEELREYLDQILLFIGSTTLTDEEFNSIDIDDPNNKLEVYNALLLILDGRESVTTMQKRLKYYFLAQGVAFAQDGDSPLKKPKSNIYIGSVL